MSGNDFKEPIETLIHVHRKAVYNLEILSQLITQDTQDKETTTHFISCYLEHLQQIAHLAKEFSSYIEDQQEIADITQELSNNL